LEDEISRLVNSRKQLEADVSLKKKNFTEKRKIFDTSVSAEIDNILPYFIISSAAYHGGKLDGVNCHKFICLAKQLFPLFEAYLLLAMENPDRCLNAVSARNVCALLHHLM
jgi:hypothetical protein